MLPAYLWTNSLQLSHVPSPSQIVYCHRLKGMLWFPFMQMSLFSLPFHCCFSASSFLSGLYCSLIQPPINRVLSSWSPLTQAHHFWELCFLLSAQRTLLCISSGMPPNITGQVLHGPASCAFTCFGLCGFFKNSYLLLKLPYSKI